MGQKANAPLYVGLAVGVLLILAGMIGTVAVVQALANAWEQYTEAQTEATVAQLQAQAQLAELEERPGFWRGAGEFFTKAIGGAMSLVGGI